VDTGSGANSSGVPRAAELQETSRAEYVRVSNTVVLVR
jgi:hypothetical protein